MSSAKETEDGHENETQQIAHRLCIDLLLAGRPRAFRELFRILKLKNTQSEDKPQQLPSEMEVNFVRLHTLDLEDALFQENLPNACDVLCNIVEFYLKSQSLEDARYFCTQLVEQSLKLYESSMEEGEDAGPNSEAERLAHAYSLMGAAESANGDTQMAIASHTRQLEVAKQHSLEEKESQARRSLINTHSQYAEELDSQGEKERALGHLQQCLQYSESADDNEAVALCKYKIGKQLYKLERYVEAVALLKEYLAYCQKESDGIGECAACYALAQACLAMNDIDNSVSSLEAFLELARNSDHTTQARACCTLGRIMYSKGNYEKADRSFEKFFILASEGSNQKLRPLGRVNMGLTRAKINLQLFYKTVNEDLGALLNWKNDRMPFANSQIRRSKSVPLGKKSTARNAKEESPEI